MRSRCILSSVLSLLKNENNVGRSPRKYSEQFGENNTVIRLMVVVKIYTHLSICIKIYTNKFMYIINIQVKCEVNEKTSQDASDGLFESSSFQSAACYMVRASEDT